MNTDRIVGLFYPAVSFKRGIAIFAFFGAIVVSEAPLFYGNRWYTVWLYSVLLVMLSLAPLRFEKDTGVFLALALIPVFRLVNLTMPVFFDRPLYWLPFLYGPFVIVFGYLVVTSFVNDPKLSDMTPSVRPLAGFVHRSEVESETWWIGHELPWIGKNHGGKVPWIVNKLRKLLLVSFETETAPERRFFHLAAACFIVVLLPLTALLLLLAVAGITVYLAVIEYGITAPQPLIPSLAVTEVVLLAIIMIVFVGFVEEFLFRGLLQRVLEKRLGLVWGLLLTSGLYGVLHSVSGANMQIAFAAGVGLVYGIVYDVTDSIVLVSVMHGMQNVLVFGVIPLSGVNSLDSVQAIVVRVLRENGILWASEPITIFEIVGQISVIGLW